MPWVQIREEWGDKAVAEMNYMLRQDGTLGYYVVFKRYLPGSQDDVHALFVARYGGEGGLKAYVTEQFKKQFDNLIVEYEMRAFSMREVAEDDVQEMLKWLSREECD